jgi:hypothetical protein
MIYLPRNEKPGFSKKPGFVLVHFVNHTGDDHASSPSFCTTRT